MKIISIQQPWATLIVLGHKKIETRSWRTKYRGPIGIHASALTVEAKKFCPDVMFPDDPFALAGNWKDLPYGAIIGVANLVDVLPASHILHNLDLDYAQGIVGLHEKTFGDYSSGRYGWRMTDPLPLDKPIPAKGQLGIWNYETLSPLIGHAHFEGVPSQETIKALNQMVELAHHKLKA